MRLSCAQSSVQLPEIKYTLILGGILITRTPGKTIYHWSLKVIEMNAGIVIGKSGRKRVQVHIIKKEKLRI